MKIDELNSRGNVGPATSRMRPGTRRAYVWHSLRSPVFTLLLCSAVLWFVIAPTPTLAQQAPPAPATSTKADDKNVPPAASRDVTSTFKVNVNLVTVRVVVRDEQGHAVGNLRREQFQLFDRGKPQTIDRFSVEVPAALRSDHAADVPGTQAPPPGVEPAPALPAPPDRYIAFVFDDIHTTAEDLIRARQAAEKHLAEAVLNTDRIAIFTTSGRMMLDFTDDHAKLRNTLLKIQMRHIAETYTGSTECPYMNF